ncbi:hypothetical protein LTR37_006452 [Vermiconidia calcicola]|uniref:Uncharacterized protein n=1 Tax=Vermiconidia calcicola TaxID=1690605 RepID=A0ACC3NG85_9PEZI|nr:hypothetical protein LTR37_006452 [Vermiconidia calcicola]
MGCVHIAIADIVESRIEFALDHGFADVGTVVSSKRPASLEESISSAKATAASICDLRLESNKILGRTDVTFECTGVESCIQAALYTTKSGGKVALVGMGTPNVTMPLSEASARELDLIPVWRYANCYPQALELADATRNSASATRLAKLITHRYEGLEHVPTALQTACFPADGNGQMVLKVVVSNSR